MSIHPYFIQFIPILFSQYSYPILSSCSYNTLLIFTSYIPSFIYLLIYLFATFIDYPQYCQVIYIIYIYIFSYSSSLFTITLLLYPFTILFTFFTLTYFYFSILQLFYLSLLLPIYYLSLSLLFLHFLPLHPFAIPINHYSTIIFPFYPLSPFSSSFPSPYFFSTIPNCFLHSFAKYLHILFIFFISQSPLSFVLLATHINVRGIYVAISILLLKPISRTFFNIFIHSTARVFQYLFNFLLYYSISNAFTDILLLLPNYYSLQTFQVNSCINFFIINQIQSNQIHQITTFIILQNFIYNFFYIQYSKLYIQLFLYILELYKLFQTLFLFFILYSISLLLTNSKLLYLFKQLLYFRKIKMGKNKIDLVNLLAKYESGSNPLTHQNMGQTIRQRQIQQSFYGKRTFVPQNNQSSKFRIVQQTVQNELRSNTNGGDIFVGNFKMSKQECEVFLVQIQGQLNKYKKNISYQTQVAFKQITDRFNRNHQKIRIQILDLLDHAFRQNQKLMKQELFKQSNNQAVQFTQVKYQIKSIQQQIIQYITKLRSNEYRRAISQVVLKDYTRQINQLKRLIQSSKNQYLQNLSDVELDTKRVDCIKNDLQVLFYFKKKTATVIQKSIFSVLGGQNAMSPNKYNQSKYQPIQQASRTRKSFFNFGS